MAIIQAKFFKKATKSKPSHRHRQNQPANQSCIKQLSDDREEHRSRNTQIGDLVRQSHKARQLGAFVPLAG